ncbi:hypothetical protein IV203_003252 [Nitzschia inconspicua]|uniref:Uncharacterized protein n=1 Tax=Nitzschia inconspicua TaxID=303405 RepID=A0A9K3L1S6_9STRA|nr:hypothetical protein IV203_003252 [Nitzschia inconspicua]
MIPSQRPSTFRQDSNSTIDENPRRVLTWKKGVRISNETTRHIYYNGKEKPAKKGRDIQWYSRKEMAEIRFRVKKTLLKTKKNELTLQKMFVEPSSDGISQSLPEGVNDLLEFEDFLELRGLERWSGRHHSFLRSTKILECKSGVFLEQAAQFISGRPDPERLRKASEEASRLSRHFAELLGKLDAEYIRRQKEEIDADLR